MTTLRKPKVYFACSITGGRACQPTYAYIVELLEAWGYNVPSKEFVSPHLTAEGTPNLTSPQIHEKDLGWLAGSDLIVAEATTPSLGLGYALGTQAERNRTGGPVKPVIVLARSDVRLSSMIGPHCAPGFVIIRYDSHADLASQLAQALAAFSTGAAEGV